MEHFDLETHVFPVYMEEPSNLLPCGTSMGQCEGCGQVHSHGIPTLWRVINPVGQHVPVCPMHLPKKRVRVGRPQPLA